MKGGEKKKRDPLDEKLYRSVAENDFSTFSKVKPSIVSFSVIKLRMRKKDEIVLIRLLVFANFISHLVYAREQFPRQYILLGPFILKGGGGYTPTSTYLHRE